MGRQAITCEHGVVGRTRCKECKTLANRALWQQISRRKREATGDTVSAADLARALALSADQVRRLKAKGIIVGVPHGLRLRFVVEEARAAVEKYREGRAEARPTTRRCSTCKIDLPVDAFPTITVRDKRCKPGHSWTGPAHVCRECSKKNRREWRRKKAESAGKTFVPHGDRVAWEVRQGAARRRRAIENVKRISDAAAARRRHLAESPTLLCLKCEQMKARADFHASTPTHCKACVAADGAVKNRHEAANLLDPYIKRRIYNDTRLRWADIPQVLIEAKRAHLAIQRIVNPRARKQP